MNTLLLRLVGPMQAWGVQSQYKDRDTGLEPSKSGVVGLLAAALGRERDADLSDLAVLPMGVRVDREGARRKDFHTAGKDGFLRAGGGQEKTDVVLSTRWYLADAAFLVGLESDSLTQLETLQGHLQNPRWPLFLGRRAFVPAAPIFLKTGVQPGLGLWAALARFPWLGRAQDPRPAHLRLVLEDSEKGTLTRPDHPLSFNPLERRYAPRQVRIDYMDTPQERLEEL